jgi:nucleoid-associated protein YgaU
MGIFEQIKSAFGRDEPEPVKKEETLASSSKTTPEPTPEIQAESAGANTYTVQSGDTLWKIAEEHLGDGNRYTEIFEANRSVLESPDHILPGQDLKLP